MKTYLLDASVLLPLGIDDHEQHGLVEAWIRSVSAFALCPITEGALVRTVVGLGGRSVSAKQLLQELYGDPRCSFWPDAVSYVDADLNRIVGYRQVTDAYLVGLARSREGAKLATLDRGLALTYPDVAEMVTSI